MHAEFMACKIDIERGGFSKLRKPLSAMRIE